MDFASYADAWNRHDPEAVVSFMTDDATYEDLPIGEKHAGKEAIKGFIGRAETTFSSDYQLEVTSFFSTDTNYAAEWTFKGTHDGSSPQLPATNKRFAIHSVSIGTLEGGKIKENRDYWNMTEFLSQVGLMPAPGSVQT